MTVNIDSLTPDEEAVLWLLDAEEAVAHGWSLATAQMKPIKNRMCS